MWLSANCPNEQPYDPHWTSTMMHNFNWVTAYPEIVLLVMTCVITLVDLWV